MNKKRLCIGILAHVDAGKTTLSEAMLYTCGVIRKLGRVDSRDAFLDTYEMERERGITIFSKQAMLRTDDLEISLLDTPGHVDFSAEMERTLQVLDYAILVVSGMDGVQGHTRTLWKLLERYQVPTYLFINKMDQQGTDPAGLMTEIKEKLSDNCTNFGTEDKSSIYESAALCEEALLNQYLEQGEISDRDIARLIVERKIFPCYFGSALKMDGVKSLLDGIRNYGMCPEFGTELGARVFKILRDTQGNRLTYVKITGGALKVKDVLSYLPKNAEDGQIAEKVNQIRIYSGEKYETVDVAEAGCICALTGLTGTYPGQGLGMEKDSPEPVLEPVLTYQMILPQEVHPAAFLPKLRMLEEEDPMLHVLWSEELQEIQVQVMGQVQLEILQRQIRERFDVLVVFGAGKIVYKETIADRVEGIGHFEPLRHYAEVHLILEPGEPGSGMQFILGCSEEMLDKNWQRLILTHLEERTHRGVLTGSPLTDVKITVAGGRAHLKHTEGGDFRQATYRAVRQGLMQAQSILLEPYYDFVLELPSEHVGRAMTDMSQREAETEAPEIDGNRALLKGRGPVSTLWDYAKEVAAYTRGEGSFSCVTGGYGPCHNAQEIVDEIGYIPEEDMANPTGSVFCSHGSGFYVEWDKVPQYMHVESVMGASGETPDEESVWQEYQMRRSREQESSEQWIGVDEVDRILDRTFYANRKEGFTPHKGIAHRKRQTKQAQVREYGQGNAKPAIKREKYLLVDGYNVIFAWEELNELAKVNIDGARGRLMDILCDYQGIRKCHLIVVFDAYRVKGHPTEISDYHNIHVVYTKEAETADQFIEKFAHENGRKYDVTVATSDGLEQIIIRGQGCGLISAREFEKEVASVKKGVVSRLQEQKQSGHTLMDSLSEDSRKELDSLKNQ
ncbi:translation factor GTPase family protein [Jutongia huaianensis]|uniref:NYN domain-containing protein n=1 Tax=Jutongia huaianensis TaxID=2763668 RepID=A0ABR7N1R4_9FIRM|nr:TetM/TetW/TetO/TetS family tetracycline resistance ribosomal protection protein [Jutongia huaianensis]MBC8561997.1 NYN domain-containing protein [Jutongia huaianensis]